MLYSSVLILFVGILTPKLNDSDFRVTQCWDQEFHDEWCSKSVVTSCNDGSFCVSQIDLPCFETGVQSPCIYDQRCWLGVNQHPPALPDIPLCRYANQKYD